MKPGVKHVEALEAKIQVPYTTPETSLSWFDSCSVFAFATALMSGNLGKSQPRVVSLLPSATDIIAVAGAVDQLVGRSHE